MISKMFNDFVLVEEIIIEEVTEGGIIIKSPTLAQVIEDVQNAKKNNREQKLFMPDVCLKVASINDKNELELCLGDIVHADSTGMKLGNYRVLRNYNIVCKK